MTHQELLDKYIRAELCNISEYSGDIQAGRRELWEEVIEYAAENGLTVSEDVFSKPEEPEEIA